MVSHELVAYFSVFDPFLTQWLMAILSKVCNAESFKSHDSLKLRFTSIQVLCSNFVACESFLESNSPEILRPLWEKFGWFNWLWQFLSERLSAFKPKVLYYSCAWFCSSCAVLHPDVLWHPLNGMRTQTNAPRKALVTLFSYIFHVKNKWNIGCKYLKTKICLRDTNIYLNCIER